MRAGRRWTDPDSLVWVLIAALLLLFVVSMLGALPAGAVERTPTRTGPSTWIVGAELRDDADRICFLAAEPSVMGALVGPTPIVCAGETPLDGDEATVEGLRVRVTSPLGVMHAVIVKLSLPQGARVAAIACRTVESVELCSPPSTDTFTLVVLSSPMPPRLLDLIRAELDNITGAAERIRHEIDAQGSP